MHLVHAVGLGDFDGAHILIHGAGRATGSGDPHSGQGADFLAAQFVQSTDRHGGLELIGKRTSQDAVEGHLLGKFV